MHVQRETARYLVEDKHADYLFTSVKDNQPGLFAVLDALDWSAAPIVHTAADRGHDRDETRTLQVLPAPAGCFPHAAQAFLIERTVRDPHTGQPRLPWASPAAEPNAAAPRPSSPPPPAATGTSRPFTTSATSPCTKTRIGYGQDQPPRSWPPCATPPSPPSA